MAADDGSDDGRRARLTEAQVPRDTIFALSSGAPPAGIAVVRISGPDAGAALVALAGSLPPVRWASLRELRDGSDEALDRALILWMPAPATATGEDMAELHLHGGRAVVAAVLAALQILPRLRLAEPGEFTRRALSNGRIDLAEAEGLADLLQAETEGQRRHALRVAEGGIGRLTSSWRVRLLDIAAGVEAAIDYDGEGETSDVGRGETIAIETLAAEMGAALARPPAERLRDGVRIVIAGPVNAGKSSLLNALAAREAAIASPYAGTTRDVIEVPVTLGGIACILIDTAGLRDTSDPIERLGIDRAHASTATADIILWLGAPEECPDRPRSLIVHARADLPSKETAAGADAKVSIYDFHSIEALLELIIERARGLLPTGGDLSFNARQRGHLVVIADQLQLAAHNADLLLRAEHLRAAMRELDRLTGHADTEHMLDTLFARFCLGK